MYTKKNYDSSIGDALFSRFFLSLVFSSLLMMRLGMDFGVYSIWCFMSFTSSLGILYYYLFKYCPSAMLFLHLLELWCHEHLAFCYYSAGPWALLLSPNNFCWSNLQVHWLLLSSPFRYSVYLMSFEFFWLLQFWLQKFEFCSSIYPIFMCWEISIFHLFQKCLPLLVKHFYNSSCKAWQIILTSVPS